MGRRKRQNFKTNRKNSSATEGGARGGRTVFLFGIHAVRAALLNPDRRNIRLISTRESLEHIADIAVNSELASEIAGREDLEVFAGKGAVHQGLVLETAPLEGAAIEDLAALPDDNALVVVLDRVSDPHNFGAVLRSAAAFGAAGVVVPDRHAPEITGTVAKSASGAAESVPVCRVANLARAIGILKDARFWAVGLDGEAGQDIAAAELPGRAVLVAGAEGDGLRRLTRENCDLLVKIPIAETVESLNLSNAIAVALYEMRRTI